MQHVNDDMDDVFRKAAENYPLDTSSADWNKVFAALQGEVAASATEKKANKTGRFLWLLLLLPLGLICNQLYTPGHFESSDQAKAKPEKPDSRFDNTNETKETNDPVTFNNPFNKTDGDVTNTNPAGDRTASRNHFLNSVPSGLATVRQVNSRVRVSKAGKEDYRSYKSPGNVNEQNEKEFSIAPYAGEEQPSRYISGIAFIGLKKERPATVINWELRPIKNPNEQNSTKRLEQPARQKRFYAGLVAGLDATTVKFQKIENKGYDYGVLLGYQLNKRWSVESGVYLSNKYYYTDGKYINTYKMNLPPTWRIDEASGDCKMIEVPVSVKYNFSTGKKSGWFSTLGASSYFMKEEKYTYETYYGTSGPWPHDYKYKNSSNNIFSNISISGGYTHKLANFGDVRIEPYLKIPVSGMGVAKLPLFSTGIHIGVTKKF